MPESTPSGVADRNLLFGILALQLDFINREQLIAAMHAWVLDKHKSLGDILHEQGALTADNHALLEALVQKHLHQHGDDPQQSLAAVSLIEALRHDLAQLAGLSNEQAWEAMRGLTRLARALAESGGQVEIEEDVPLLGIHAGRQPLQRLIYWAFAKLYWNPHLSFEENVHVNFDWYRPRYAHRHTAAEVRDWLAQAGLVEEWFHEQQSGYTVRARKRTTPTAAAA
jgi:hypothetical protein